jgi:hypothetical protein
LLGREIKQRIADDKRFYCSDSHAGCSLAGDTLRHACRYKGFLSPNNPCNESTGRFAQVRQVRNGADADLLLPGAEALKRNPKH